VCVSWTAGTILLDNCQSGMDKWSRGAQKDLEQQKERISLTFGATQCKPKLRDANTCFGIAETAAKFSDTENIFRWDDCM